MDRTRFQWQKMEYLQHTDTPEWILDVKHNTTSSFPHMKIKTYQSRLGKLLCY
jgi:hypothetical protein